MAAELASCHDAPLREGESHILSIAPSPAEPVDVFTTHLRTPGRDATVFTLIWGERSRPTCGAVLGGATCGHHGGACNFRRGACVVPILAHVPTFGHLATAAPARRASPLAAASRAGLADA